ncbi:hypothetical protein CORC01_13183 [Colletotrichum orchidophilum]|uniref:Uncharacterized protein n=1 Tax=Colletotrichum orchidophilum TaxID=1209926 RepID=A0A1G4AQT1_9PEZI|nr:uncharacterized protein CORC01_13183 [Colletotrichum orchidophilum]OHE91534.1 hypothetical protein CORC01_13183 [Colletotrichum orchidophilum]
MSPPSWRYSLCTLVRTKARRKARLPNRIPVRPGSRCLGLRRRRDSSNKQRGVLVDG